MALNYPYPANPSRTKQKEPKNQHRLDETEQARKYHLNHPKREFESNLFLFNRKST